MKAVLIVLAAFFIWTASGWVFMHDTVSATAPEGTVLALRFTPGRSHWEEVAGVLGQIPLISNRPLTTEDIRPFTQGEFALFISENGDRSLAVHSSKRLLPLSELDSMGITTTEVRSGVFLLSDRPLAVSGIKSKWSWTLPPAPWKRFTRIGTAFLSGVDAKGPMYATPNGLEVRLPKLPLPKTSTLPAVEDAIAVLSTPLLPNTDFSWLIQDIAIQTEALGLPDANTFSRLLNGSGGMILTKDGGFLLVMNAQGFDENAQKGLLRLAAAMQTPSKTDWILPDNSRTQEIFVDPSSVTVEEATIQGIRTLRVFTKNETTLSSASKDGHFAITNDNALLEAWLSGTDEAMNRPCSSQILSVNISALNENALRVSDGWRPMPLGLISQEFSMFSLNNGWRQTKLELCR